MLFKCIYNYNKKLNNFNIKILFLCRRLIISDTILYYFIINYHHKFSITCKIKGKKLKHDKNHD